MPKVNPDILRWVRETAGFTLEEAAKKLQLAEARGLSSINKLELLESGINEPTRSMLEKMAKQYRRPLLTFYLPQPPSQGSHEALRRSPATRI